MTTTISDKLLDITKSKATTLQQLSKAKIDKMLDTGEKSAEFFQKHPKITSWLMKKSPKIALYVTIVLALFGNKNKKANKQNKEIPAELYNKIVRDRN